MAHPKADLVELAKLFKAPVSSPSDLVTQSQLEIAFAEFLKIDVADGNAASDKVIFVLCPLPLKSQAIS